MAADLVVLEANRTNTTPAPGILIYVSDTKQFWGGDGSTPGGVRISLTAAEISAIQANTSKNTNATHTGDVTGAGALTIANSAVSLAKMSSGTPGNVIAYNATNQPAAVATGIAGQILTSNGAGAAPSMKTPTVTAVTFSSTHFPSAVAANGGAGAVNNIGTAGLQGFGVGICPSPVPAGMSEITGTRNPSSDSYGNYQYTDGSIMIWIPAFYYKYDTGTNGIALNDVDIKAYTNYTSVATANAAGYALHRAFYDNGVVQSGVFVDKYQCSNNGGVASSIHLGNPLSTNSAHNPISALNNTPVNNYGGAVLAAKSRGSAFFCNSRFIFSALGMLALAHGQAAVSTTYCGWYDAAKITNYPKGNNNTRKDSVDLALTFISDGFSGASKCGSANIFNRTTHNGQNCGVADLNGNMWEVNPGITSNGTNFYILKSATRMRDLTGGNALSTDVWGTNGINANYTSLGTAYASLWAASADRTVKVGSTASQSFSSAVSGSAWNVTGAGIPITTGGSNALGNDYIWDFKPNELCPIAGGGWLDSNPGGLWAIGHHVIRSYNSVSVGFRSALYI